MLPPANEVCEGYVFTGVCLSTGEGMHGCSGGACVVAQGGMRGCSGGHAWLLQGGRAWLLRGGMRGCSWGGMRGCSGGCAWLLPGGHAWLLRGGMRGFFDEIRSMSGRYVSHWNAFLLQIELQITHGCNLHNHEETFHYLKFR